LKRRSPASFLACGRTGFIIYYLSRAYTKQGDELAQRSSPARKFRANLARSTELALLLFQRQSPIGKLLTTRFEQLEQPLLKGFGGLYTNG
jgi:hypothetical protein